MNKTRNVEIWLSTEWGIFGYLKRGKCKEWEIKENDQTINVRRRNA